MSESDILQSWLTNGMKKNIIYTTGGKHKNLENIMSNLESSKLRWPKKYFTK